METIKLNKKKTLMIAHRGLSGFERENTIPAFVAAGNHSYYGCECDIHKTIDGHFVVIHDSDTQRVAGSSLIIEESTLEEVKRVELLSMGTNEKSTSLRIPTLKEYIECCKRYNKKCIVEFKGLFKQEDVVEVIEIIKSLEYLENCIFISFYYPNLVFVKEYDNTLPCQFLLVELVEEAVEFAIKYRIDIDINFHNITKEQVDFIHSHGLKVNVWTVNELCDGERMIEYGVDYITTNILE